MSGITAGCIRNKDDLVIDLMSRDLRNVNECSKAYDLFVENNHFFEFRECMDLTNSLLEIKGTVKEVTSNVIKFLNDINRNDITSEKVYDLLSSLPSQFSEYYDLDDDDIDGVIKSRFQEKVNSILGENSSTVLINDEFRKCVDDFIHLCDIIKKFYIKLLPYFENSSVEFFSPNQRNSLRNCLAEFCSSDFYATYDVLKMRNYIKDNIDNIGIYYFVRIMETLNMIGYYSFDELNLVLLDIARAADKEWVKNKQEEIPEFRKLVFNFFAINIINDDESTWKKALDILKEFRKFFRLETCLLLINDLMDVKRTSPYDEKQLLKFYSAFKDQVEDSLTNDFQ